MSWGFDYTIDVDEKAAIVWVKIYGKWTGETAERYHEDFKKETAPLMGAPWAKIADLSNWKTSYDEVTGVIGKHMAWSRDNKVSLSIYVIDNVSTFRQLNQMFEQGGTKAVSHTFRTYAEAERYLKQHWTDTRSKASQL